VLLAAVLGSALASIDSTIVTIALPAIGRDLDGSFVQLQWVVTGYTLTLASLILLSGAAGDRYGRRRLFLIGTAWFTAASVWCAVAPTINNLIAARIFQGAGGALLTPASLAILQASFRKEDRGLAVGSWAAFSGVAVAVAPFLGGWLLAVASWRAIFLVNVPLAVLVVAIGLRQVPESRDTSNDGPLDWWGGVAGVVALGLITFAIMQRTPRGVAEIAALLVLAVVAVAAFVWRERAAAVPLLPLGLFRRRQFSAANGYTLIVYAAIGVFFLLLILQLEVVASWSPLQAGAATIPVTVVTLALSRPSGALAQAIGPRIQLTLGPLLCAAGAILALRIHPGVDYLTGVLPVVTLFGLGLAAFVAPLTYTALGSVPTEHAGLASGVNNAVARTGSLLSIAAIPALVGLAGDALEDPDAFTAAFRSAMFLCAGLLVAGSVLAALTIRRPDEPTPAA
jgi:EmrB/QacA subfamily drug resistance transporter